MVSNKKWLISWIGETDHRAAEGKTDGDGPIANALLSEVNYDHVLLLSSYSSKRGVDFRNWLVNKKKGSNIEVVDVELSSPVNYAEIYDKVCRVLLTEGLPTSDKELSFHLSPGTPAMAAIWIMLAKTRFPGKLIQSVKSKRPSGEPCFLVEKVDFNFNLANDFLPEFLQRNEERIDRLNQSIFNLRPEFLSILHRSQLMAEQIDLAGRIAVHNVPVLILGETGTGKELFAQAIRSASQRKEKPFIPVNCGAISKDLINSELFGHTKGAFTGAESNQDGLFSAAEGGTLFLDEIGELPLDAQVKLLRALQQKEITVLGEARPKKINVRVIAATHKDLIAEVLLGNFREDLFHRLAVGIINIPPLRERKGDIELLVDHILVEINAEYKDQPGWQEKSISPQAKRNLVNYAWPGNVRELKNTLVRAAIWSKNSVISDRDIERNLLSIPRDTRNILDLNLNSDFNLAAVVAQVERHYIEKALQKTAGQKKAAAELLGITNYQTLTKRMKDLGIDSSEKEFER